MRFIGKALNSEAKAGKKHSHPDKKAFGRREQHGQA